MLLFYNGWPDFLFIMLFYNGWPDFLSFMLGLIIYSASMTYWKDRSIGKKDRLNIVAIGLNSYNISLKKQYIKSILYHCGYGGDILFYP